MREDPPWAPYQIANARWFLSKSTGCLLLHPVYLFDVATICKK